MRQSRYSDARCDLCGNAVTPTIHPEINGEKCIGRFEHYGVTEIRLQLKRRRSSMFGRAATITPEELLICPPCSAAFQTWATGRHSLTCLCGRDGCPGTAKRRAERGAFHG